MTDKHANALFRRLVAGESITESDRLHAAECAACRRAIQEAVHFDEQLRRAAQELAVTPMPPEVWLDALAPPMTNRLAWLPSFAAVAAAAVIVGLSFNALRTPVGEASPFPSNTSASESPAVTTHPSTGPTLPGQPFSVGDLVAGPYGCGDGSEGFVIWIPSGWYANASHDGLPACRYANVEPFEWSDVDSPPIVPISVDVLSGDFAPTEEVLERQELTIADLPALRLVLAGEKGKRVLYVIGLDGTLPLESNLARYVLASTHGGDQTFDRDSATLDEMLSRFDVTVPFRENVETAIAADALFDSTATCMTSELGFGIEYPVSWFANSNSGDIPACSWFGPTQFTVGGGSGVPNGAEIGITILDGAIGTFEPVFGFESLAVAGRPAQRTERYGGSEGEPDRSRQTYEYVIQLADKVSGRNLVATIRSQTTSDYNLTKAVLDRMLATLEWTSD